MKRGMTKTRKPGEPLKSKFMQALDRDTRVKRLPIPDDRVQLGHSRSFNGYRPNLNIPRFMAYRGYKRVHIPGKGIWWVYSP